jgi:hypothetical protein
MAALPDRSGAAAALRKGSKTMSMRNRDKIKQLEHELGRYEKRCGDRMKLNAQLSRRAAGVAEISIATDALLAQVAITYGEDAVDPDTGAAIGKRLTLPKFDARETYRKYEVHARRDGEQYIIGVGLRDDPADHKGETEAHDGADVS